MTQLTHDDIKTMTPAEIVKADEDGRLNEIKGIPAPHTPGNTLTRDDVNKLYAEGRFAEITTAADEGRIHYEGDN
ncbi:hypothetical protein [Microbacterium sp. SD291]|uniref:hypothetical protein n=1 Tax=Microbacterium sp. SD291 TaxID=2782007 RepID=UPI001A97A263|nr:hypothetical protein [Microbacterium sp. SD291]MBO0979898.1 hypothetical protein [Microbacterium sp. SD291]